MANDFFDPVAEAKNRLDVSNFSDAQIYQNLSDPAKFRQAFPEYTNLDDDTIRRNMQSLGQKMPNYVNVSQAPATTPIHAAAAPTPSNELQTFGREVKALGANLNPLAIGSQAYHAFADAPTQDERDEYANTEKELNEAPGTETSGAKRVGLGLNRLITQPVEHAIDYWKNFATTDPDTRNRMESDILTAAPEGMGAGGAAVIAPAVISKALGAARGAMTRVPQASVVPEAANMHPAAVQGAEHIFRAAAPVGSDPGFRSNIYAAAGDLNEIGQKLALDEAKGGFRTPDMRVRATVDGINDHLSDMYQQERAPQIARNASAQIGMQVGPDSANGLRFLSRAAGTAADRAIAAKAQTGALSLAETDQLARAVNAQLRDFESMTPSDRAAGTTTQRRLASLKALDQDLSSKIADELSRRGEPGIKEYERRYAALSSVRDQLQARMNMSELQRRVPGLDMLNLIRRPSLAGASQAAVANVNIGDALQKGFSKLAQSGITPNRAVGTGAPNIAGLLTSSPSVQRVGPNGPTAIPLGSQTEPIGAPSGPSSILPYRPSLQAPPQFVRLSEITPAAPEQGLLNPERPELFPKGRIPKQGRLFQKTVERGSKK